MPERSREVVRNELDIPQDAVVLLSVGTLRMQKRLRVILQAMARLRNREQLHYVICGEGPDMPFLPPAGLPDGYSGYAGRCGHFLYAVPA